MDTIKQAYVTGERALFHASDVQVEDSTFAQGESPLKEAAIFVFTTASSSGNIRSGIAPI